MSTTAIPSHLHGLPGQTISPHPQCSNPNIGYVQSHHRSQIRGLQNSITQRNQREGQEPSLSTQELRWPFTTMVHHHSIGVSRSIQASKQAWILSNLPCSPWKSLSTSSTEITVKLTHSGKDIQRTHRGVTGRHSGSVYTAAGDVPSSSGRCTHAKNSIVRAAAWLAGGATQ